MRRYISAILVPSLLLYFTGCTTLTITSKEEVKQEFNSGTNYQELYVITKDNNRYHLGTGGYQIKNDTLHSKGSKIQYEWRRTL